MTAVDLCVKLTHANTVTDRYKDRIHGALYNDRRFSFKDGYYDVRLGASWLDPPR